jgi:hypothetical protein
MATKKLNIDLKVVRADWEEFRDLQISFLRASVSDAEAPTDYVMISVLFQEADRAGVQYILNGHSFRTEGLAPLSWTYLDGRYIRKVHERFGKGQITSFPVATLTQMLYYCLFKRIQFINVPQYFDYRHHEIQPILEKELDWKFYGGHHHESIYTEFFQSYFLPTKFHIDKRLVEYSALIRSGQMTREEGLEKVKKPYHYNSEIVALTLEKLGLTKDKFQEILDLEPRSFKDFPSYYLFIRSMRIPIKIGCMMHLIPPIFYEKYFP